MVKRGIPFSRFFCAFAGFLVLGAALSALAAEHKAPVVPKSRPAGKVQPGAAGPQAQPPTTAQPAVARPVMPADVLRLRRPDLVLTAFAVHQNDLRAEGMYAKAPFQVIVGNAGQAKVPNPFYVALQFSTAGNPWQGENDGNNCFRVTALLDPNQTYRLTGTLKVLSSNLSDRTLKLRALADFTCLNEFPTPNGDIAESNESNNFSNEVSLTGGYLPGLSSVDPGICTKGSDDCVVNGQSLGSQQGDHTVVVERGAQKTAVTVKSWANAVVHFTVPDGAEVGESRVYIADSGTLSKVSNALTFTVAEMTTLPWSDLVRWWNENRTAFSLRLHTWAGGPEPNNQSQLNVLLMSVPVDVPNNEIHNWAGYYRFLMNDMNSAVGGIVLSKADCGPQQLRLNVAFESEGKELIGYYKVNGPAGTWRRSGAPDIEIDNGRLGILFFLYSTGGALNYTVTTTFTASVHASNSAADDLMNLFMSNWNDNVKAKLWSSVRDGLMKPEIKTQVIDSLMTAIRMKASLPASRTICKMEFTPDAIKITSY
jgi:hypothetical protein